MQRDKIMETTQNAPEPSKHQEAQLTADYRQAQFDYVMEKAGEYKPKLKIVHLDASTNYMNITIDELEAIQAILTKKVYDFNELPEDIQQEIIERVADINVDYEWWNTEYEDAKNVLLKIDGFDLDRNRHCTGDFIEDAEECAKKIIAEHGEPCETWGTATNYLAERAELVKKYSDGVSTDIVLEDNEYEYEQEQNEMDVEFLRSILEDYSIILQKQYEYLTGEESIIETIKCNEYKFTEDGEIV